jgi:hypothetical protein
MRRSLVQPLVIGVPRAAFARADSETCARSIYEDAVARGKVEMIP